MTGTKPGNLVHYRHIHDLAWDFVDAARARPDTQLDAAGMNALFLTLGIGDYEAAIDTVLVACADAPVAVSPELADRLAAG
ncbi:hypothetical protein [Mycobacterium sp. 360MFTsu5.1]|uniref:hypothetical protein n=1 Tax=Mycobacterium sp. 360MFTsu5.1 TaxID=1172186 RepID=UPI00037951C6|nr:hypothetical protein [Mycobacterium sp. 360MFTsu5.1]